MSELEALITWGASRYQYVTTPPRTRSEGLMRCPTSEHEDRHPSCSYNYNTDVWNCMSCDASGNAWQLYRRWTGTHGIQISDEALAAARADYAQITGSSYSPRTERPAWIPSTGIPGSARNHYAGAGLLPSRTRHRGNSLRPPVC